MNESSAKIIYLKDYAAPEFSISNVELIVRLFEHGATIISKLTVHRRSHSKEATLRLNGEDLELRWVRLDGRELAPDQYQVDEESLSIKELPDTFILECETWIKPQENKRLEGLYKSSSLFCTQCEAEGFRRITYYLDRPDVMAVFQTRIEADASHYPMLLSNGNPVESGVLANGRHFVTWQDPFPKPCYLFALVAGNLHCQEASFRTCSGRDVALRIFVEHKNADKCDFALACLKRAMKWDEEIYGREYDLDIFMIVAVDDFNMGAMENKGLNIFNASCVLAKPEVTTDVAYQRIEGIIAHEYFHNWSGNRVTCRDWFQLSLKEGFTVFRDAEFSADMNSREVKRIEVVNLLRTAQFAQDSGPLAHPVRPASYMEISNFYTVTIYEKGAEVVRMLHILLGPTQFRAGCDLYFERHDGQAVTTDDFVAAMEDVSGRDLTQFKRWYDQAGTPEVSVASTYDAEQKRYTLTFTQTCPASPDQAKKEPFVIPITLGLLNLHGQGIQLAQAQGETSWTFELTESVETVVFDGIDEPPIPSLLRGFSAPVKLHYDYSDEQLLFLMAHDTDGFNRWDAGQSLSVRVLQRLIVAFQKGQAMSAPENLIATFKRILGDTNIDQAMVCKLLMLPTESYLIELADVADVDAIYQARQSLRAELASALNQQLLSVYHLNADSKFGAQMDFNAMSRRALKNSVLLMLSAQPDEQFVALAMRQFEQAANMTDKFAALSALVNSGVKEPAAKALQSFYDEWHQDAQVLEQWFSVQAGSSCYTHLEQIKSLISLPDFELSNPNKVRSVIGVYSTQNLVNFHALSGSGYDFLAEYVMRLDDMNPQIAARLLAPLTRWQKYDATRRTLMLDQLKRIHGKNRLSKDVREVVEKSLS